MSTLQRTAAHPVVHGRNPRLNHAQIVGAWRNTDAGASGGLLRLVITEHQDRLGIHVLGAGRPQAYDWGEVEAQAYAATPTSTTAFAFRAVFDFGAFTTILSAYTRVGILNVTTYNQFADARQVPYWTREFFYRDQSTVSPASVPYREVTRERDRVAGGGVAGRIDVSPLVATWRSFDLGSTRVARVQITERDQALYVRPHGVWTPRRHDWHEAVGTPYAEDVHSGTAIALTAAYDLYHCRVEMVGYVNRRLLVVEAGNTFVDGSGQSPYFTREHFYPT